MKHIGAICVLSLVATVSPAAENLVRNAGFEDAADRGKAPAVWSPPRKGGTAWAWDDQVRRAGKRSARVVGLDAAKQTRFVHAWRQNVGPLDGRPLRLSVWVRAEKLSDGRISVLHKDATGKVLLNQSLANITGTFDWKEFAAAIEPPRGTRSLQLVMGLRKSTGTVWFDDVVIVAQGKAGQEYGRARLTPSAPQPAGKTVSVRIEVDLGRRGLGVGGSLQLRWENWRPAREFRLRKARAAVAGNEAKFQTSVPPRKKIWPPTRRPVASVLTLVEGGPLKAGTVVTIDTEMTYTKNTNVQCALRVVVTPAANTAAGEAEGRLMIRARGGPAETLRCVAESRPVAGKRGRLTVAVTDAYGNPSADFRATVSLACSTSPVTLPAEYAFTAKDAGSHTFDVIFPPGKVSRVTVRNGSMQAVSNPVLPREAGEPGVYFGDIHTHCEISADAVGDPDAAYDYARRFWGLDFAALTDHSPRSSQWKRTMQIGNRHNTPGRFATILGFEYSHPRNGHRNAYYRADAGPEQPRLSGNMTPWWNFFDKAGVRVITVPHHPNTESKAKSPSGKSVWGPMDWSVINHTYQRLVEVCQIRGAFEAPGGPVTELRIVRKDVGSSVQTALGMGHRLGLIGSTDTHSGRPGTGPARCAILAAELTRTALWDALHARRCYATSGKHILVMFAVNGRAMGREISVKDTAAKRHVTWRVVGTGPLKRVDLLRSNTVVKSWPGGGKDDLSGQFTFAEPLTKTEWWYLRAIQKDTEIAWSSPVWLDPPKRK